MGVSQRLCSTARLRGQPWTPWACKARKPSVIAAHVSFSVARSSASRVGSVPQDGADDSRTNHQDVHRVRPPLVPGPRVASATGKRPSRPDALTEPSRIVLPSSLSAVATMTARLSQRRRLATAGRQTPRRRPCVTATPSCRPTGTRSALPPTEPPPPIGVRLPGSAPESQQRSNRRRCPHAGGPRAHVSGVHTTGRLAAPRQGGRRRVDAVDSGRGTRQGLARAPSAVGRNGPPDQRPLVSRTERSAFCSYRSEPPSHRKPP